MSKLLKEDEEIKKYLTEDEIQKLLDVTEHIGTAPERAKKLVEEIKNVIKDEK